VTIGTNYAGSLQVTTAGWVNKGTVSLTIPAKDQTYALSSTDLAETDHSFKIDAASGTLMKSLTINTKVIFDRLAAI
jgi:dihydrodipicolinate reductase